MECQISYERFCKTLKLSSLEDSWKNDLMHTLSLLQARWSLQELKYLKNNAE